MPNKETIITGAMILLITYTLCLSLVSQVFPATQTSKTLSNTGSIQIQTSEGIGIYSDFACSNVMESMSWGTLEPGTSRDIVCYIRNEGSDPTTLSLETSNWIPTEASTYLDLSWDYDDQPMSADDVIEVTFTLTVSASIDGITTFSFDITIIGTTV